MFRIHFSCYIIGIQVRENYTRISIGTLFTMIIYFGVHTQGIVVLCENVFSDNEVDHHKYW